MGHFVSNVTLVADCFGYAGKPSGFAVLLDGKEIGKIERFGVRLWTAVDEDGVDFGPPAESPYECMVPFLLRIKCPDAARW